MQSISSETINDALSERELQRIARMEMCTALDNYLKRKRLSSTTFDSTQDISISSLSSNLSKGEQSQSSETMQGQQLSSTESHSLKEPLRTYDIALSNVNFEFRIDNCRVQPNQNQVVKKK